MATGGQKRTRWERVAALELPPGQWERAWISLRRRDVLGRIGMALLAAVVLCLVVRGWEPPFPYRTGYTPGHDILARVPFSVSVPDATNAALERQRSLVRTIYVQDPLPLVELRAQLRNTLVELASKSELSEVDPKLWQQFALLQDDGSPQTLSPQEEGQHFRILRAAVAGAENLQRFERALEEAFKPFEQRGLLHRLSNQVRGGNQEEIIVYPRHLPSLETTVKVADVLIGDGTIIRESLRKHFQPPVLADRLFAWLKPRLKPTLTLDKARTDEAIEKALREVQPVTLEYTTEANLGKAGVPLTAEQVRLLREEHQAWLAERAWSQSILRAAAVALMSFALFVLCGVYMRFRQRGPLDSVGRLAVVLVLAVVTVAVARWTAQDAWRAEILPLLLFGMTMSIAYSAELALLLTGVLSFLVTISIGQGLSEFLLLAGVTTYCNLNMTRIRTRSKLIYVGITAGGLAALLHIGLGVLDNQPLSVALLTDAARNAMWTVAAGFLMTGLLPFVERFFGVLTDLSLLELGDVTHPLLQELARRAPSTYNHSITVGAIAEAAAESIGARGLLCRVGAYFHDIGKMLKPGYFAENQGAEASRHEGLVPAMSTLVIIAHIKDGADLARQHHLPQPIIDMIAQHHGTTLVEYFYDRANEQRQSDPNGGQIDENTFRYPGPRPQTKEAAVLMLADAVESASRTLVDPTPARIESLVREIAENRLRGGQFDESGLTLRELRTVEKSMAMSLISIYHGRIKYPEQKRREEEKRRDDDSRQEDSRKGDSRKEEPHKQEAGARA